MNDLKKSLRSAIPLLIILMSILVLFYWYTEKNHTRIEHQNLNYASDSARQTASRIEMEFRDALNRVSTYSFFLEQSLSSPDVTLEMLSEMGENSMFDTFRFIDADGINYATDGRTADYSQREEYLQGIQGESGLAVAFQSQLTNETMMNFYVPVRYQGQIIGVLQGVYFAEDYLRDMLSTSYFGEAADVFLCTLDGTVIASSDAKQYEGNLVEILEDSGMVDADTARQVAGVFQDGGEGAFICASHSRTDNICVIHLSGTDYVLVQTFPESITQTMTRNANSAGILLEICLVILFFLYIIFLVLRARRTRRQLEKDNRDLGYVFKGVNTLFARFALVDFEEDTYRYLAGTTAEADSLSNQGAYPELASYLCSLLIDEADREHFARRLSKDELMAHLTDSSEVRYERHVRHNGKAEWEHINIICVERKNGAPCKALLLRQVTTEIKERELRIQAEISLANRKERQFMVAVTADALYTHEFNLTRDLIEQDIIWEIDGNAVSLLAAVGLSAPCKASEWFAQWEKRFVSEESQDDYHTFVNIEYLMNKFLQGEMDVTVDYWSDDSLGHKICIRKSFYMTRDDTTQDIMVMVVVKEITSQIRKQMEETQALQDALMEAQHANNAKTTFLSNMSHDIRTPMNAIIGFATIAVTHIDNRDQVKDCLQKVLSSSNHLLSLINDILDMSRIESGKVQIKEQDCNISELMHNLVNIIQPQVKAKQLEMFIDTFDITNEDVIADSLKLSQVFVNLMSNAVKYTPSGGTISFCIQQRPSFHRGYGDYVFLIKDNGIGMSPEFVEHIFEPFEREASTTKTGIQGTGLGMAITKNIVDMMGGTITVESEKGKGSEFKVELSLKLQDGTAISNQIEALSGLRTLVVDDDPDTCSSVSKMLKQIGMQAEWTTSGKEAVYRAKSAHEEGNPYHTYIIDWQMPGWSGIETTRKIRSILGNDAPIIILTAYDWTEVEEDAKEAGVTAFCAKPLFMSDLKSVLLTANRLIDTEEETATWASVDFQGKRILLVEDNELNREIAVEILSETGFEVETAPDGTDAVAMMTEAEENYYDAILMDVQMPIMDGYEATRTIRSLPRKDVKDLPIIAMTANAMEEDKETALKNGMSAHVAKPIDIELFISILGKFIK